MTYPKAIVISAALIATAIAFAAHQPAQSAMEGLVRYIAVSNAAHTVWVIDTTTGQTRYCSSQGEVCSVMKQEIIDYKTGHTRYCTTPRGKCNDMKPE